MNSHTIVLIIYLFSIHIIVAQKPIILYDEDNPTARVCYHNKQTKAIQKKAKEFDVHKYPVVGNYTPTHHANTTLGIEHNAGFCDYVYFPTNGELIPGRQYTLTLKIKFDKSFDEMPFFQDNFGIALTSYMYPNKFPSDWGLWEHTYESLGQLYGDEIVTIEKEIRPLCTSKYVVFGVFETDVMDHLHCFMCYYPFEIYELSISESEHPEKPCAFVCDEFKDEIKPDLNKRDFNVYFESGSSEISNAYQEMLDSLSTKLISNHDIILLNAYTDISGNDNFRLGVARNKSVKDVFISNGIDPIRIIESNLADLEAAAEIISTDRRVEINLLKGNLSRQHYSDALKATKSKDYSSAHKMIQTDWLITVSPKVALAAYFDEWGESEKADIFKAQMLKSIKSKFYRNNDLVYKLDSLNYQRLKGRGLASYLASLRMPSDKHDVYFATDFVKDSLLRNEADAIINRKGFPELKTIGRTSSQILPDIILTSNNLKYLRDYLPIFKKACEERKIEWEYYAILYDKINIKTTGLQRYGTQMNYDYSGIPKPSVPLEDPSKVDEYRRQVRLFPFNKELTNSIDSSKDKLDKDLVASLNDVYIADQHYRNSINKATRNFDHWRASDSLNQIKVKKILDERGWLGPDVVGRRGNQTLFLVIQHSDLETQLKYLPMMRKAVEKGNAFGYHLALLEDRVALGQGRKQIYGSQIQTDSISGARYVAPLIDPENVNSRRAEVGLGYIEYYVSRWNIDWEDELIKLKSRK